jgi:predicted P-loop ATPase
MIDTARREKIQAAVAAQRAMANRLRNAIADVAIRDRLRPVLHFLDDVNRYFLDSVDRTRTAAQESELLDHAESLLQFALRMLHDVNNAVLKYDGPESIRAV